MPGIIPQTLSQRDHPLTRKQNFRKGTCRMAIAPYSRCHTVSRVLIGGFHRRPGREPERPNSGPSA